MLFLRVGSFGACFTSITRCLFVLVEKMSSIVPLLARARPAKQATSRGRQERQSVHRVEFRAAPRERTYVLEPAPRPLSAAPIYTSSNNGHCSNNEQTPFNLCRAAVCTTRLVVEQPSGGDSGSGSDAASLSSESDDGDGGGGSHLALLENFFPTLADSLRRHLEVHLAFRLDALLSCMM